MWARLCILFGALMVLFSGAALAGGAALINFSEGKINRGSLLDPNARRKPTKEVKGPLNFLLAGSDYRQGQESDPWRADTIIVAHIPKSLDKLYLLSLPRDLQVKIPRCPNAPDGCTDKINAAFAFGGMGGEKFNQQEAFKLLSATVTKLTEIKFDIGAVIDFYGFTKTVGALGGVTLCLDQNITSIHTNLTYRKGCHWYNEHAALDIMRQRYAYNDGDLGRQKAQQRFLKAIIKQATDSGTLTDPAKLNRVMTTAGQSVTLDSPYNVTDLALGLRNVKSETVKALKLPTQWNGNYFTLDNTANDLFAAMRDDKMAEFVAAHPEVENPL